MSKICTNRFVVVIFAFYSDKIKFQKKQLPQIILLPHNRGKNTHYLNSNLSSEMSLLYYWHLKNINLWANPSPKIKLICKGYFEKRSLRTFAPKSSYGEIFFISPLELVDKVLTPKMKKKMGVTDFVSEKMAVEKCLNFDKSVIIKRCSLLC